MLFSSCQKKPNSISSYLTKEERADLDFLFKDLMIRQSGVFVLFGNKPLCEGGFLDDMAKKNPGPYLHDPLKGWQAWEKIKEHFKGNRFILVKKTTPISLTWPDGRLDHRICHNIVLADIERTAFVLSENYEIFKNLVGFDFHPLEIVFDLEDPNSSFWNKIFYPTETQSSSKYYNHMAMGLLFGFGKKNTLFFSWKEELEKKDSKIAAFFSSPSLWSIEIEDRKSHLPEDVWRQGITALKVPGFIALANDDTYQRYEWEKKKIQKTYKGKDFLEVTLDQLSK